MKTLQAIRPLTSFLSLACFLLVTTSLFLPHVYAQGSFKYTCSCTIPNGHSEKLQFGTNNDDAKSCVAKCQKSDYNSGVLNAGAPL